MNKKKWNRVINWKAFLQKTFFLMNAYIMRYCRPLSIENKTIAVCFLSFPNIPIYFHFSLLLYCKGK